MRRALLALIALALLVPGRAAAACGLPTARADYESPEVQAYAVKSRLIACYRATGRERTVGVHVPGHTELTTVGAVLGRRWILTTTQTFAGDEFDDVLTDLRTGKAVRVRTSDSKTFA